MVTIWTESHTNRTNYHISLVYHRKSEEEPIPPEKEKKKAKERTPTQKAKAHAYYLKHREAILLNLKERYQNDEVYREKARERSRERYRNDPEYHDKSLNRAKQRYYDLKAAAQVEELEEA